MQPAHLLRQIFQSIISQIRDEYETNQRTGVLLDKSAILKGLLGDDFERALRDYDSSKITLLTDEFKRKMYMIETSPCKYYFVLKFVDFCTCQSFRHRVLKSSPDSFLCKHIIIVRLADAMSNYTEKVIHHEKMSTLLACPPELDPSTNITVIKLDSNIAIDHYLCEETSGDVEEVVATQPSSQFAASQATCTQASQLFKDLDVHVSPCEENK